MTMSQVEIDEFLNGVHLARVATVRPDGRPHVAPVWYLWDGDSFYFETGSQTVKANNLRANPNIAITVDVTTGGMRIKHVILEGAVELIEDPKMVRRLTERIFSRYVGIEGLQTPTIQEILELTSIIVKLKPSKFVTYDHLDPSALAAL